MGLVAADLASSYIDGRSSSSPFVQASRAQGCRAQHGDQVGAQARELWTSTHGFDVSSARTDLDFPCQLTKEFQAMQKSPPPFIYARFDEKNILDCECSDPRSSYHGSTWR